MSDTPESIYAKHLAESNGVDYDAAVAAGHSDHDFITEFGGAHEETAPVVVPQESSEYRDIDPRKAAVVGGAAGLPVAGAMAAGDVLGMARDKFFGSAPAPAPAPKVRAPIPASTMIPIPKNLPTTEFPSPELRVQPKEYYNPHGYGEPATKSALINQDISDVHSGARATGTMGSEAPRVEGFNRQFNNRLYTPQGADIAPTPEQLRAARQIEMEEMRQKAMDKIQRSNLSEAAKQEARRAYLAQEGSRRALESSTQIPASTKSPGAMERLGKVLTPGGMGGKILNKIVPVGALAGAGAEFADASNRYHRGDLIGAGLSGLGGLGSVASVIPTPMTRGIGTALSLGTPALNYGIDKLRGAPVKKADGGGIRLSQDDIIRNAINKPSRAEILKRMGSDLGKQALDQGKKEFKSYAKPHAFTDIGNDWVSTLAGSPVDLVNMVLQPVGLGSDNPVLGSKYLRDLMIKNNMHTGEERPLTNIGSSFIMPQTAVKGLATGASRVGKEALRQIEDNSGLMGKLTIDPRDYAIKNTGGNWNPIAQKNIEDSLGRLSQNADVSNWANTTGRKYILNRLGTPQDEVKQLFDKGITHITPNEISERAHYVHSPHDSEKVRALADRRYAEGFPEEGTATTPAGKVWEDVTDASITPRKASYFQENADLYHGGMPDWVGKLDPNATLHDESFFAGLPDISGMDKLTAALERDIAAGKLHPSQLNQMSIEGAVRRAHQHRAESDAAAESVAQAVPKVREYPEGYAWHDLTHEDPTTLETILGKEGSTMQNCVGESCSDILENGTKIYSLRDAHGNPHVNIEVISPTINPNRKSEYIRWEDAPEEMKQQFGPQVTKRMTDNPGASYVHPERMRVAIDSDFLPKINQIKGKQNRVAVEDYHPYVQDFINNPVEGNAFSEIKDVASAGMEDADRIRKHGLAGNSMSPYYGELDRIFPSERGVLSGPHGVRIPSTDMLRMATENMPGKYVTQQDVLNHLATQEARPLEQSYSKFYDNLDVPHMAGGRLVESYTKIPEAYRKAQAMIEAENNRKKFSQVLIPHEGSYLGLTQSDNFGIHGNRYGGTQFPMFQQFSPIHKDNKVVWMNDTEAHANSMAKNSTFNNKPVVWTNYIGSPDQLRSNKSVFQDVMDAHYNRDLSPEQIDLINARIKALSKGNAKKPVFQEPFDIRDKFAVQELGGDTFGGRRTLVNMLGEGEGVNKTKSGIILPNLPDILASHRDPITEGVGTSSIGSRLFTVDPTPSSYSKAYHPDYNWTVHGEDLDQPFDFTPHSVLDWYDRQFNLVNKKGETGKVPHGNSWFNYMNNPQFISDKFIQRVEDAGYATGGQVPNMAGGKSVMGGGIEAIRNAYEAAKALPPAENAARTQIIGTLPTYQKAGEMFQNLGGQGKALDFGAGLGEGAKILGADTFEPYAKNWTPTYSNVSDIPSNEYGKLTNLNVLNVMPREMRDQSVSDIGRVMDRGGLGILTTRGKDVMKAQGRPGPEPTSIITSRDTYQKGFTPQELEDYLKYILGSRFDINKVNLGPAGAVIRKK